VDRPGDAILVDRRLHPALDGSRYDLEQVAHVLPPSMAPTTLALSFSAAEFTLPCKVTHLNGVDVDPVR
jgi:hypothetical protein